MLIHLDDKWFKKIENGTKTIELRLYDENTVPKGIAIPGIPFAMTAKPVKK